MTLVRRVTYASGLLAMVFALSLGLVLYLRAERGETLSEFQATFEAERATLALTKCVEERHREVELMLQTLNTLGGGGEAHNADRSGLQRVHECRERLEAFERAKSRVAHSQDELDGVTRDVGKLLDDWVFVYETLGEDQTAALIRQMNSAAPLADDLLSARLPAARDAAAGRIVSVSEQFSDLGRQADWGLIAGLLLPFLILAVTGVVISRRAIGSLETLLNGIDRFGEGALDERVELAGDDEFTALSSRFNGMADRLSSQRARLLETRDALSERAEELQESLDELKKAQSIIIQQQKLAALGSLVAGVAHEVNTPLGVAYTSSTLVRDEVADLKDSVYAGTISRNSAARSVKRLEEVLAPLINNIERASELVRSFKQVARDRKVAEVKRYDFAEWVDQIRLNLQPFLATQAVALKVDIEEPFTACFAAGELEQALTNLVVNACIHGYAQRAAGPGQPPPEVRLSVRRRAATLVLVVEDDGVGMEEAVAEKVFEPFFTTRRDLNGTGLGMHITHEIITGRFEGIIELETAPGRGARWKLSLPVPTDALTIQHEREEETV